MRLVRAVDPPKETVLKPLPKQGKGVVVPPRPIVRVPLPTPVIQPGFRVLFCSKTDAVVVLPDGLQTKDVKLAYMVDGSHRSAVSALFKDSLADFCIAFPELSSHSLIQDPSPSG